MNYTMERIFQPIGHVAFYTERFYERDNDEPSLSVVYENVLYKPLTQDMATERYAGHIRVSDTASGNVVRHGRMGYKGVYGRMARPWFVKEEIPHGIIRRRGICIVLI